MVFAVIEPAFLFPWLETVVVPFMARLTLGTRTPQKKRISAIKGRNLHAILNRLDFHAPVARVRGGMKVAVVHQSLQLHLHRTAPADERILNKRGVFALAHPDAFFNQHIGQSVDPYWCGALKMEALDVAEARRIYRAAGPVLRSQGVIRAGIAERFIQRRDKLRASERGLQSGYQ